MRTELPRSEEVLTALEPGQLTAASQRPLPRRKLSRGVLALLLLLRGYVVIAIPIVAYAFVHAIMAAKAG